MKQKWKQIGGLLLSVCMATTVLPAAAFAETNKRNELNMPGMLMGTSTTGSAITIDISQLSDDTASGDPYWEYSGASGSPARLLTLKQGGVTLTGTNGALSVKTPDDGGEVTLDNAVITAAKPGAFTSWGSSADAALFSGNEYGVSNVALNLNVTGTNSLSGFFGLISTGNLSITGTGNLSAESNADKLEYISNGIKTGGASCIIDGPAVSVSGSSGVVPMCMKNGSALSVQSGSLTLDNTSGNNYAAAVTNDNAPYSLTITVDSGASFTTVAGTNNTGDPSRDFWYEAGTASGMTITNNGGTVYIDGNVGGKAVNNGGTFEVTGAVAESEGTITKPTLGNVTVNLASPEQASEYYSVTTEGGATTFTALKAANFTLTGSNGNAVWTDSFSASTYVFNNMTIGKYEINAYSITIKGTNNCGGTMGAGNGSGSTYVGSGTLNVLKSMTDENHHYYGLDSNDGGITVNGPAINVTGFDKSIRGLTMQSGSFAADGFGDGIIMNGGSAVFDTAGGEHDESNLWWVEHTAGQLKITTNGTLYSDPQCTLPDISVVFEENDGSAVADTYLWGYGTYSATKPGDPAKAGSSFGGWYTDAGLGTPAAFPKEVSGETTFYAKWDSASGTVTGTMDIGGQTGIGLSDGPKYGTGWSWNAVEATLTLDEDYTHEHIRISCADTDTVNLEYSGNVTVESSSPSGSAIYCFGNLIVDGIGGILNVEYTGGGDWCAMEVLSELQITGGNLDARSNGNTSYYSDAGEIHAVVIYGGKGVTISGNANVTAAATGTNAYGIYTDSGDFITISTNGTVTANGTGSGYAILSGFDGVGTLNISDGTVVLNHSEPTHYYNGTLNHTGGTLNGRTPDGIFSYGITVGGIEVTSDNKDNITGDGITGSGTVSYNPDTKTLTLNDAKIAVNTVMNTAIEVNGIENLTINLTGSSQLGEEPAVQRSDDYKIYSGIFADGKKITVTGGGNLTIYDRNQGIVAKDITIDTAGTITIIENGGGEACCLKADGGTLEIKSGTLNLSSAASNGLYGDTIIISGGTVTAESLAEGSIKHYAFNKAPEFAPGYKYKVYAGNDKNSLSEIKNPVSATFTNNKYVKIIPDTSGGTKPVRDDDDDDKPVKPTGPATPAEPPKSGNKPVEEVLNDVGAHWAINSIQFVYDRGIMTGTSANTFSPDARINRGMLITALGRLAGINVLDFTSGSFGDVDTASYYAPYAEWSLISNITRGTGNNNFSPDNPVTREELAVILVNFAKAMGYRLPSGEGAEAFGDDSSISTWAREAIGIMRNANIMNGDTNNSFNPKAPATRAEIAAVLQRFIELMGL